MKKDFKTFKNLILLIASALSLVAVTFAWYSLNKSVGNFVISQNVSGTTIAVSYYESADKGSSYKKLVNDLTMSNMQQGDRAYYKMDIKTFKEAPVKLVMGFDGISSNNITTQHVYFDYKVICNASNTVISDGTHKKMSDYASDSVFAEDISLYQRNNQNEFTLYYEVYVEDVSGLSNETVSLGEVKLTGQQIS